MATSADALRRRLEDRAELLETALVRARALRLLLGGLFWRGKLARNAGLLHQMAEAESELELVLASTRRRAEAEGWHSDEPLTRCVHELTALREQLIGLASRRLRVPSESVSLADLLLRLDGLIAGPRKILPGQKWSTALEVLPRTLPELERAQLAGERLALLFSRPAPPSGELPLTAAEVTELRTLIPEAEQTLQVLWRRVHGCDPSGGLLRFLQRRARRAPTRSPRNGPELLLSTAFWSDLAHNRLRALAEERFSPVQVLEGELLELLAWLVSLGEDPDRRLPVSATLDEARSALLELSQRLAVRRSASSARGSWSVGDWERLVDRARVAEQGGSTPDLERVRETLRLFVKIRERERGGARGVPGDGLVTLVERARDLAEVPRPVSARLRP